jgi:glyoxylase-like metal-dependent hydrolase (beta-lactamase superfamily II)
MIYLIPAGNPGPFTGPTGNNTWLVDGAEPLLVDAGVGHPEHLAALEKLLGDRPLSRVFLTHAHRDHSAGVPHLRARWPGVEIAGGAALDNGAALRGPRIADGGTLPAGDRMMQVVSTPGHSPDHACLWDEDARIFFAGDLLVASGTVMIDASSGGGLRGYLASLARVRELDPARIYPGHGPFIDNGAALIDQYVAHRMDRERQVLDALAHGPSTVQALVKTIYPLLDPAIAPAAEETLIAHLAKLEEEEKVQRSGESWILTPSSSPAGARPARRDRDA